ncbi:MAG TPA: LysR family transcriptional regulator [Steroidobacteraceae bacterium]
MGLRFVEDFLKLAETGSFSRAAEERHVTQPAFSRRIKSLENYLGVELINRSTYPLTLTAAGLAFRESGLEIIKSLHAARKHAREVGAEDSQIVKVAALHSIAIHYYPRYYDSFRRAFGPFTVQMTCDSMHGCMQSFIEGACHYLVVFSNPSVPLFLTSSTHPYLVVEHDRLVPVCAPGPNGQPLYPLPGKPGTPRPYLSYGPDAYLGRVVDELLQKTGRQAFLKATYVDNVAEALKSMARAGHGVAWLPRGVALAELAQGSLVQCGDEHWTAPLEVRVYHRDRFTDEFKQVAAGLAQSIEQAARA